MPFEFKKLEIPELILIESKVFNDDRGYFLEHYKRSAFVDNGITEEFCQDNHSCSAKKVLRGLHYQLDPKAQGKLVYVIKGRIWDVAVDIRKDSPTFLKWIAVELTGDNHKMLYIPAGFAHGFVALEDNTLMAYKCTNEYSMEHDRGITWNDSHIKIHWPVNDPILSSKDKSLPTTEQAEFY